jgi:hypothetical protein
VNDSPIFTPPALLGGLENDIFSERGGVLCIKFIKEDVNGTECISIFS